MTSTSDHLSFFDAYASPVLNITTVAGTADFVTPAKARGLPPFAVLLHGVARASLDVPEFRLRVRGGRIETIEALQVSYTVIGANERVNFSTFGFDPDFSVFLGRYLDDRPLARTATNLRKASMADRAYLFVTALPWLSFTSIQHPTGAFDDCSIPSIAIGRFDIGGSRLTFPLAVQVHHGLVDGLHIARYVARVEELMEQAASELAA